MREVSTCDFCGGEAAGTFEVVPAERHPNGDGRRMVLCPGCRDTLASVLEPLLAGTAGDDPGSGDPAGAGPETTTVVAEPDRESGTRADTTAGAGDDPGDHTGEGSTPSADGVSSPGGSGEGFADGNDGGPEPANTGSDLEEAFDAQDGVERAGEAPRSTRSGTPRGYRKVMRFLENREFPVDRDEAETLAAEAYGLDPGSVSAAVDHAIKHNRLREVSGQLRQ
jgi:hypothetical protein